MVFCHVPQPTFITFTYSVSCYHNIIILLHCRTKSAYRRKQIAYYIRVIVYLKEKTACPGKGDQCMYAHCVNHVMATITVALKVVLCDDKQ